MEKGHNPAQHVTTVSILQLHFKSSVVKFPPPKSILINGKCGLRAPRPAPGTKLESFKAAGSFVPGFGRFSHVNVPVEGSRGLTSAEGARGWGTGGHGRLSSGPRRGRLFSPRLLSKCHVGAAEPGEGRARDPVWEAAIPLRSRTPLPEWANPGGWDLSNSSPPRDRSQRHEPLQVTPSVCVWWVMVLKRMSYSNPALFALHSPCSSAFLYNLKLHPPTF